MAITKGYTMEQLLQIFNTKAKPKELTLILARSLLADKKLLEQMVEFYGNAKDSQKGTCLSALAQITKDNPQYIKEHLDFIIGQINHKAPRVKWESSEIIANITKDFPESAQKAVPLLLKNINDEGTVVRWSAAYALTEIAKSNPKTHKQLLPIFRNIISAEENNGVKNIYLKAMKILEKSK
jgi:hypothetical protein